MQPVQVRPTEAKHAALPESRQSILQAEQGPETLPHIRENFCRRPRLKDDLARLPIEILDVVGEDDANDGAAARAWTSNG